VHNKFRCKFCFVVQAAEDDSESDDEHEMQTASSSFDSDDMSVSGSENEASSDEASIRKEFYLVLIENFVSF